MPPLTVANVLAYVLQVAAMAAVTGACLTLARVCSPRVRYGAWRGLLWLAVALPLVQPWTVTTTIVNRAVADAGPSAISAVATTPGAAAAGAWDPLLLVLLAGTAFRLLWLIAGTLRLAAIARRAGPDPADAAPLQQVLETNADVRYSADIAQPATYGVRRPIVLLPLRLRSLNASVRHAVLAHELLHVKRRDWTALMTEELLRAVFWFNPAVWWLVDRVHAAREEVVDAQAIKYTGGRRNYVRALLAFADAPAVAAAPAFAHRRHLFARIKRLCEESPMSPHRLFVASCLVAVAAGTSGVYAVGAFPIQAAEDVLIAPAAPVFTFGGIGGSQDVPPPPPPAPPAPAPGQDPPPPPPSVRIRQTPAVLREVRPQYPVEAMRAGIEGNVEIEVTIGEDGKVTHARVIHSANPALDNKALEAARQWLFAKPTEGSVTRTIELTFTLRGSPPAPPPAPASAAREIAPEAVRVGGNIKTPMKTRHVNPRYPAAAREANLSGMVVLEILIGRDGRVENASVLRSMPLLDKAAIEAVTQWEFRPTLLNGTPVPVIMTVTVQFTYM